MHASGVDGLDASLRRRVTRARWKRTRARKKLRRGAKKWRCTRARREGMNRRQARRRWCEDPHLGDRLEQQLDLRARKTLRARLGLDPRDPTDLVGHRGADAAELGHEHAAHVPRRGVLGQAQQLASGSLAEVAIVGDPVDRSTRALAETAYGDLAFRRVVAVSAAPDRSAIPLLRDRVAIDGAPTAYVCRGFACRLPVTTADALADRLAEAA